MERLAFVNRVRELSRLRRALSRPGGALIVVYGRRRCGKSRLGAAMGATLPAVPIRVDSVLPFRSRRVFESRVAEYLAARGNHRPVVVVGWPTHGERQLVDGRHRMAAATVLGLEAIPACFAMFADARRWGDGGCW